VERTTEHTKYTKKNALLQIHNASLADKRFLQCCQVMNIKLHVFQNTETLHTAVLELFTKHLPHPGGLMLSGGNTPLDIYHRIPDGKVEATLFLSDERYVLDNDSSSNYGNIRSCFADAKFIRVETEFPLQMAADRFHDALRTLKEIPLGLLGLGTDGHTASLFSLEDAALRDSRLAIPVKKTEKPDRISVTPTLLNHIDRIIILATGEAKREVIRKLLNKPETIPAGVALADHPNVELWTNIEI